MHRLFLTPLIAATLLASNPVPVAGADHDPDTITQDELVRRTQELLDAVVPGSQEPWKKYYADDCLFADEKERQMG
jgi:hypothetical protein